MALGRRWEACRTSLGKAFLLLLGAAQTAGRWLADLYGRRQALGFVIVVAATFALGLTLGSAISMWTDAPKPAPERMALLPMEPPEVLALPPAVSSSGETSEVTAPPSEPPRIAITAEPLPDAIARAPAQHAQPPSPAVASAAPAARTPHHPPVYSGERRHAAAPEEPPAELAEAPSQASPAPEPAAAPASIDGPARLVINAPEADAVQPAEIPSAVPQSHQATPSAPPAETARPQAPGLVINGAAPLTGPTNSSPQVASQTLPEAAPQLSLQESATQEAPAEVAEAVQPAPRQAQPHPPPQGQSWQRNAVQLASFPSGPVIALVIDDVGLNRPGARRSIALPPPVTLALMTYAEGLESLAGKARAAGHELMVHMPMQPIDDEYNAGEKVLTTGLSREELIQRINWGLDRFPGYVGINNHMGSRFTANAEGMATVMEVLKQRGLLFLDSRTVGHSLGVSAARSAGVPVVARDIFIDHEQTPGFIAQQLRALEELAVQRGYAIGIGHPHVVTLEALENWIPQAKARGIAFVPVSAILSLQERHLAAQAAGSSG